MIKNRTPMAGVRNLPTLTEKEIIFMADDFGMGYALGADSGGSNGGNGMWGGDGIWAFLLFALIFGIGYGGFGGFGGFGGQALTRAELYDGFAMQNIDSAVRGVQQGICDSTYALNNSLMSGFHGVDSAICNLGYQTQAGFNTLGHQISDCCCQTQRAIDGVNYNMATQFCALGTTVQSSTRDIIDSQNAGTRAILDFLTQDKIATLTAENQSLKFQASQANQNAFITANQEAQTAELIRRLGRDCPVPAYVVPNPNCCYGNPVGIGYNNGGCGCGCG